MYLSVTRGKGTRLNSQVMIGGGCAVVLHENLATEPSVTTSDVGWIVNDEIPATKQNTPTLKSTFRVHVKLQLFDFLVQLLSFNFNQVEYLKRFLMTHSLLC